MLCYVWATDTYKFLLLNLSLLQLTSSEFVICAVEFVEFVALAIEFETLAVDSGNICWNFIMTDCSVLQCKTEVNFFQYVIVGMHPCLYMFLKEVLDI